MSSVFDVAGLSPSQSGSERVDADHERAERRSGAVCACVRAVPQEWYTEHSVRRLGFHGTSHRVVSERAAALLGRPVSELRLVTAHLGNGCSATAVRDGVSVDTTMGLTPLDGLVMGTRSGEVDPGVLAYVARRTGQDLDELTRVLNTESGLLGLSGVSNDMRTAA